MTKDEQLKHFGMEIPEKYRGYVLGRTPPWSIEYYTAVLGVAESYNYDLSEKEVKVT